MPLFETIIQANQRGQRGGQIAALLAECGDSLPVAGFTCIDARLNQLVPEALGVPEDKFIWLRNAGNIITGPLSSTLRSLALACAVKGAKEIAIIGHSDCLVCKHTVMQLTERFSALGIARERLPENLVEYFGLFASERQNVMKAAETVRSSPLIGPKVPVHGLMLDLPSGRIEWVVNGYQTLDTVVTAAPVVSAVKDAFSRIGEAMESVQNVLSEVKELKVGDLKFPSGKIGDLATEASSQPLGSRSEEAETSGKAEPLRVSFRGFERAATEAGQWLKDLKVTGQGTEAAGAPSVAAASTPPPLTAMEMARRLDPGKRFKVIGRDQKLYGPVTVAELLSWLADNRIDHATPVQREDSAVWKPLGSWLKEEITQKVKAKLGWRR